MIPVTGVKVAASGEHVQPWGRAMRASASLRAQTPQRRRGGRQATVIAPAGRRTLPRDRRRGGGGPRSVPKRRTAGEAARSPDP